MRILTLSILIGCFLLSSCQSKSTGQKAISLFNGKDLSGWSIQNNGQFTVEDGLLKINRGTGWLRSDKNYRDFILTIEFRFLEKDAKSGIFVRTKATSKNDEKGYPENGYQVQTKDTFEEVPLAHMIPYGAPPFEHESDIEALRKAYKPAGEWHVYEIKAQGEQLWVKLNDVLITTATSIKHLEGYTGIQGELGLLEFRKIEILEL